MNKETFITIVSALEEFYTDTYPVLSALGMMDEDAPILRQFDLITEAVSKDIDPKNIGELLLAHDAPLLYDYLFSDILDPFALTPSELYDYITKLYQNRAEEIAAL